MATFPKWRPDSRYSYAWIASSNRKTRSTTVVDCFRRPENLRASEFRVAGRGNDAAQACRFGQLKSPDRNTTGTQKQHRVARLQAACTEEGAPGRKTGAGQGCRLNILEARGYQHQGLLVLDHFFSQCAVASRGTERVRRFLRCGFPIDPIRKEAGRYTVPGRRSIRRGGVNVSAFSSTFMNARLPVRSSAVSAPLIPQLATAWHRRLLAVFQTV
jgi:hypothetical protein